MQLKRAARGFTLAELAVVFAIIALLLGGAMMTLSAQVEQRNNDETVRRLNAAAEAVLAYAIVNRRLPCPATAGTTGDEAPAGGGSCSVWSVGGGHGGFLPARTIGFQPVDTSGYGMDAWGNRLRYAVATLITGCTGSSTTPHFTSEANLKANGVSCRPNDLDICSSSAGSTATSCNTAPRIASTQTVAFVVYSTGKNGAITGSHGADETENTDGDRVFVSRTPSGADATGGTYDDLMVFVPAGVLYSKLISAAILP